MQMQSINFNVMLRKVSYILHQCTLIHFLFQNRCMYVWAYTFRLYVNNMRLTLALRSWRMEFDAHHKQEFLHSPLCLDQHRVLPRIMTILYLAIREV
jgi:hypothetical protein